VLVAEDNPVNQMVALKMLERLGYRVDVVADGAEALGEVSPGDYDAVLMDVQRPKMDGYEATGRIREREGAAKRTPVIAMTAKVLESEREEALWAGMDDYVVKPVKADELDRVLGRWTSRDDRASGAEGSAGDRGAPTRRPRSTPPCSIPSAPSRKRENPTSSRDSPGCFSTTRRSSWRGCGRPSARPTPRRCAVSPTPSRAARATWGATRVSDVCGELEMAGESGDPSPRPPGCSNASKRSSPWRGRPSRRRSPGAPESSRRPDPPRVSPAR
jgi:CheY-like chemotaxis protein